MPNAEHHTIDNRNIILDPWSEDQCWERAAQTLLEIKSAALAGEGFSTLIAEMVEELGAQFADFRRLRAAAELACASSADEAAGKLARADLKAATDAMSVIVRTLEKLDALQRQIARDRELDAEKRLDEAGYEKARTDLIAFIEARVAASGAENAADDRAAIAGDGDGLAVHEEGRPEPFDSG